MALTSSRRLCGQRRAEVGVFFWLFSLDSSSFFKDGILTRIALHMLGTGWKDFGIAVGGRGATNHQTDMLFPVLFLFSKTDTCDSGAWSPPRRSDSWPPSPQHPQWNLCVLPWRHPNSLYIYSLLLPCSWSWFLPPLSDPCISYYVRYHLPEKRPCADYWEHCSCFCVFSYLVVWF